MDFQIIWTQAIQDPSCIFQSAIRQFPLFLSHETTLKLGCVVVFKSMAGRRKHHSDTPVLF